MKDSTIMHALHTWNGYTSIFKKLLSGYRGQISVRISKLKNGVKYISLTVDEEDSRGIKFPEYVNIYGHLVMVKVYKKDLSIKPLESSWCLAYAA